jgi:hypothetical protein
MDDQSEQTAKPTKRTGPPKGKGQGQAPKTEAPARTRTPSKRTPVAEAPAITGSRRPPKAAAAPSTRSKEEPEADATPIEPLMDANEPRDGAPSRGEMSIAYTPGQMAVGGAIVAGLLVFGVRLLLGRRRGRG